MTAPSSGRSGRARAPQLGALIDGSCRVWLVAHRAAPDRPIVLVVAIDERDARRVLRACAGLYASQHVFRPADYTGPLRGLSFLTGPSSTTRFIPAPPRPGEIVS